MLSVSLPLKSRYVPVVGRAFLVEALYGSKYSPHIGTYEMPYLYVKSLLFCATGRGLAEPEGRHVHGLVEVLLPSNLSEDNLTKLELLQFVDSVPLGVEEEDEDAAQPPASSAPAGNAVEGEAPDGDEDEDEDDDCGSSPLPGREESGARSYRRAGGAALADAAGFINAAAFPLSIARVLLYDAVSACLADDLYTAQERERVALVASQIGVSSAVREEVERLVVQERVIAARKRKLLNLTPTGIAASTASPPTFSDQRSGGSTAHQQMQSSLYAHSAASRERMWRRPEGVDGAGASTWSATPHDHYEGPTAQQYVSGGYDDVEGSGGVGVRSPAVRSSQPTGAAAPSTAPRSNLAAPSADAAPASPSFSEEQLAKARALLRAARSKPKPSSPPP